METIVVRSLLGIYGQDFGQATFAFNNGPFQVVLSSARITSIFNSSFFLLDAEILPVDNSLKPISNLLILLFLDTYVDTSCT